jgi:ParB family chromosome partitioning protein
MSYPIVYALARNCVVSDLNVRTENDAAADAELEALIGEAGFVLQNLIGVAVKRKKGHYSIFGGGRRLRRVHSLIEQGKLPEDFTVPVMVFPNSKDAIELSLAENQKLPMNPADECTAYKNIIEMEGKTPAQVAARFGKTERFILGRLRLADLAEPVFSALRKGAITLDVAQAYGSSSDTTRQARVFEQLRNSYYRSDANEIRLQLATGTYLGGDPKALLVGREAYQAAGGRIDSDLFSDEANERWVDAELVDRLAEENLAAAAEATREREGFAEVRTVGAEHVSYRDLDGLRPVRGEVLPLTAEQEVRCAEIEAELEQIEEAAADEESEGYTEDDEARTEALQAEYESIRERTPVLTDEQKASAIAYLVIGSDGQPHLHHQFYVAPQPVSGNPDGDEDGDGNDEASWTCFRKAESFPEVKGELDDKATTVYKGIRGRGGAAGGDQRAHAA